MKTPNPSHALVVLSGGQDSTTCLYWALSGYEKVSALTFDYGQLHKAEIDAATNVWTLAAHWAQEGQLQRHHHLSVGPILRSTSPLVSSEPLEQYRDYQSLPDGLEKTFVPMRNQLFLTLAANVAVDIEAGAIITGVCQEDFGGYPDCRQEFISKLNEATVSGLGLAPRELEIVTPLMHLTKAESVELAFEACPGGYLALAFSHTAYDGKYPPTGHDHASLLRHKGFVEAGLPDPLVVRAWDEGLMPLPPEDAYSNLAELKALAALIRDAQDLL